MKIRTLRAPQWVQLEKNDPARFHVRPLTGEERMELSQHVWLSPRIVDMPAAVQYRAVRRGLIGWDGLVSEETGEPVPFSAKVIDDLRDGVVAALVQQIYALSTLGRVIPPVEDADGRVDPDDADAYLAEDEAGNSDSQ